MKAVRLNGYGGQEVLELAEVDDPCLFLAVGVSECHIPSSPLKV